LKNACVRLLLSSSALLCLLLAQPAAAQKVAAAGNVTPASIDAGAETPVAVVEKLHSQLLDVMKRADELGFDGRLALLRPVLSETFDLAFVGEKVVGNHWNKLSEDEQKRWIEKFSHLMAANYAGRFSGYNGESFRTLGEEAAARDTRVVLTKILVPSDEDVQLNYRLIGTASGWRIIDVYLNGTVSELALRRSEYSATLKRDGFDKLTAAVDDKIAELSKKKGGG
jgi:phospholipid transport system substrate-binding protein